MSRVCGRVALIGLGLIASSIAHAVRRGGLADEIAGHARSAETRGVARADELVDRVCESAAEAAEGADVVVLCVPVGAMGEVAAQIAPALKPGAIVTDVGSVKASVIEAVAPHIPDGVDFVPAHPLAGTEHSGPRAGFAELFDNRYCLIVPPDGVREQAVETIERLWRGMGAMTERMAVARHDRVLAVLSHVPHLIAYAMVGMVGNMNRVNEREVIEYSAAGFRDFTRIAASDPVMWRDVFLNNRRTTLEVLDRFTEEALNLRKAIQDGDGGALLEHFERTRTIRRGIVEAGQDTGEPDFGRGAAAKGRGGAG